MQDKKQSFITKEAGSPIYKQIADILRQQIRGGEYVENQKLPSTKQISQQYNVNHLTARQALKELEGQGYVTMESGRGTFVKNRLAESVHLAVILPTFSLHMPEEICSGIYAAQSQSPVFITVMNYQHRDELELQCIQRLQSGRYHGAILLPGLSNLTIQPLLQLLTGGFPLVFIDRGIAGVPCWKIASDNFQVGCEAARHFLECGIKNCAMVAEKSEPVLERIRGFRETLNNSGIPLSANRVWMEESSEDEGLASVEKILAVEPRPDGVFFFNDYHALTALRQFLKMGLRVPEDIQIIGCDDIEASRFTTPSLTTVKQNFEELGRKAFLMMMELIALPQEKRFQTRHETTPVALVHRESTQKLSASASPLRKSERLVAQSVTT